MSTKTTVMVDVPPGDQTGIYYITICNLPFTANRHEIKDWLRTEGKGDVAHVEIFEASTSGWICLRGKDDLDKAWKILKGSTFNGRTLVADDRNRTQSITIRMIVGPGPQWERLPPPVVVSSQMSASGPAAQYQQFAAVPSTASPQYASVPGQSYATGYSQAGGPSYSGQSMSMQGYGSQPYNYSGTNAGSSYGVGAGYPPNHQNQFALPYRDQQVTTAYYAGAGTGAAPGIGAGGGVSVPGSEPASQTDQPFISTQARKLHVSPFPQEFPPDKLMRWIQHKIYEKQTIKSIDIPMNRTGKYIRGHAFVVFHDALGAAKAMEELNQMSYKGRPIIARPTVEGVTADESQMPGFEAPRRNEANLDPGQVRIPTGPRGDRSRGDKAQRPKQRESNKGTDADSKRSSSDKKTSSSSTKKSSKTSSKKTSPDKEGSSSTKDADGSSRKHGKR